MKKICEVLQCEHYQFDSNFGEFGHDCKLFGTIIYNKDKFIVTPLFNAQSCKLYSRRGNILKKVLK